MAERPSRAIVLVTAYRQQDTIGRTVAAVRSLHESGVTRVVVADDGSPDRTAVAAEAAGAEVVRMPANLGKGGATGRAIRHILGDSTGPPPDILALADGDLGDSATELERLITAVAGGEGDMAVAVFPVPQRKGGFGLVKGLARWGIRRATGLEVQAPLSGQRAMTWAVARVVLPTAAGFGLEVGLTIDAARAGFRVVEVPTQLGHAETGRDLAGFMHRGRQFWDVLKALAPRLLRRPVS